MNTPIIALQPPDPQQAVETCQQYLERCQALLASAQTWVDVVEAHLWIDNATRQLARWQAQLDRQAPR